MITTVQTASIWNVGIKTAAAQNMVAIGFIEKTFNKTITWLEWLIAAAPFGVLMSVALYFVMTRMMPPEVTEVPGGREGDPQIAGRARADEGVREEAAGDLARRCSASGRPKACCTASTPRRPRSPRSR